MGVHFLQSDELTRQASFQELAGQRSSPRTDTHCTRGVVNSSVDLALRLVVLNALLTKAPTANFHLFRFQQCRVGSCSNGASL